MSTSVSIPRTQAAIQSDLKGLWLNENDLNWHRAALVYVWVDLALDDPDIHSQAQAFTALAKQKVQGLGSNVVTVKSYFLAWESAINTGVAEPLSIGMTVNLPTDNFGNYWKNTPKAKQDARRQIKITTSTSKPTPKLPATPKVPEVATVQERGERIVRELELQVKMETDDGLRVLWESALKLSASAVGQYKKSLAR